MREGPAACIASWRHAPVAAVPSGCHRIVASCARSRPRPSAVAASMRHASGCGRRRYSVTVLLLPFIAFCESVRLYRPARRDPGNQESLPSPDRSRDDRPCARAVPLLLTPVPDRWPRPVRPPHACGAARARMHPITGVSRNGIMGGCRGRWCRLPRRPFRRSAPRRDSGSPSTASHQPAALWPTRGLRPAGIPASPYCSCSSRFGCMRWIGTHYIPANGFCQFEKFRFFCTRG